MDTVNETAVVEDEPWTVTRNRAGRAGATFGVLTALIGAALSILWAQVGGIL